MTTKPATNGATGGAPTTLREPARIRVAVLHDQQLFGEALLVALSQYPQFTVMGSSVDVTHGQEMFDAGVDVVLLSLNGHDLDSLHELKDAQPPLVIVVLIDQVDFAVVEQILACGVGGVVTKLAPLPSIVHTLEAAHHGQIAVPVTLFEEIVHQFKERQWALRALPQGRTSTLTTREIEILNLLTTGSSSRTIAEALYLSINTVRSHVQSILTKLDAHSRLEAVAHARRSGIVEAGRQVS